MEHARRILIVDDDYLARVGLRQLLEREGYQVDEAESGEECLRVCASALPDLVLLDLVMPDLSGLAVCSRLKAQPSTSRIPVVFLSGMQNPQDKVEAFKSGGVDYITKPFNKQEVLARVRTHLELVAHRQRLEEHSITLGRTLRDTEVLNRKLIELNEQLRQSEEVKGQFLATMRKELDSPLGTILSLGVELESGQVTPERTRAVGTLIASRLVAFDLQLRNIFSAAELEAGVAVPWVTQVDAVAVAREVQSGLDRQAREKEVRLELAAPDPRCSAFYTDGDKLGVILANLISNGIKFSPAGSSVRTRLRVEEGTLVVEVEDQGTGIRAEEQPHIFRRFQPLPPRVGNAPHGQGLGLSVVKALADLLDGSITVSSEPGCGSVFTCGLPERRPRDSRSVSAGISFLPAEEA